ncbi:hypothetical protein [Nocardia yamanashiensis]|uniref:hypothetical protein n=1 Tax=Nocardia yamanashiensis TaxID=209247 RepID=UPI0012FE173E|nr:hypothetical protein [Nocardia yamanashiensis]
MGGVQGSGSSFDSQGTAGDSPPPDAPGRPVSAGLLCLAALLLLAASLMPLLTWKYAGMRTGKRVELQIQRDAWRYRYGGVTADRAEYHTAAQYLWIPLLLCGCAATAVAALLYLRTRRRGPQPRSGAGYLAAGTTFGVAVAMFAAVLPPSNRQQDGDYTSPPDCGHWCWPPSSPRPSYSKPLRHRLMRFRPEPAAPTPAPASLWC